MIVVSDTTCLSTLIQVGKLDILKKLYSSILIPPRVYEELKRLSEVGIDVNFLSTTEWIQIKAPLSLDISSDFILTLDAGETEAIALAMEVTADYLIIDEKKGHIVANSLHLPVIGLGGILIQAKGMGIIESVKALLELIKSETGFYLSQKAYEIILRGAGETP